jgi:hypothetical protein
MDHPYSRTFTLSGVPTALAAAVDCTSRVRGEPFKGEGGSDYGTAYAISFRLQSEGGDAPVFRALWLKENGAWRITAYDVEVP